MAGAKTLKKEVEEINKSLQGLLKRFSPKGVKEILKPASEILVKSIRSNIKDSKKPHHRYSTPKLVKSKRAPKGFGVKTATYYPGNLRKSIRKLNFRKSPDLWVGPRLNKRKPTGMFGKGNRVDGWYAHFQEFGTVNNSRPANFGFIRKGFNRAKYRMVNRIRREAHKKVLAYARKIAV